LINAKTEVLSTDRRRAVQKTDMLSTDRRRAVQEVDSLTGS
jgi:hypothetical protein